MDHFTSFAEQISHSLPFVRSKIDQIPAGKPKPFLIYRRELGDEYWMPIAGAACAVTEVHLALEQLSPDINVLGEVIVAQPSMVALAEHDSDYDLPLDVLQVTNVTYSGLVTWWSNGRHNDAGILLWDGTHLTFPIVHEGPVHPDTIHGRLEAALRSLVDHQEV